MNDSPSITCPVKPVSPDSVLDWVVRITEQRNEDNLAQCLVDTLAEMGEFRSIRIDRLADSAGKHMLNAVAGTGAFDGEPRPLEADSLLAAAYAAGGPAEAYLPASHSHIRSLPIQDRTGAILGFLTVEAVKSLEACSPLLEGLAAVYRNYVDLLGDAERDTLTALKNRKTFDEKINRVIAASARLLSGRGLADRRRFPGPEDYHWLGILDIDHFKRVNDEFGHVFGDEVLLLFAQVMRKTFRTGDLLFRYGGEEFVVVLEPTTFEFAQSVFERFRRAIEAYDFPQVGKVTCSIGYIRILPEDIPTSVVGHADQALYFAKRNGRNRVCSYELLVQQGLLVPEHMVGETELFS